MNKNQKVGKIWVCNVRIFIGSKHHFLKQQHSLNHNLCSDEYCFSYFVSYNDVAYTIEFIYMVH